MLKVWVNDLCIFYVNFDLYCKLHTDYVINAEYMCLCFYAPVASLYLCLGFYVCYNNYYHKSYSAKVMYQVWIYVVLHYYTRSTRNKTALLY